MKLKKLVMRGYRSIKQEQTLYVDDRVTILIGANDHGKSNILAAIKCLNDDSPLGVEDKNWDSAEKSNVEIRWHFEASDDDIAKLGKLGPRMRSQVAPLPEAAQPPPVSAETPAPTSENPVPSPPLAKPGPSRLETAFEVGKAREIVFSRDSATNKVKVVAAPIPVAVVHEQKVLELRPQVELFESPSGNVIDQVNLQQLETPEFEFMQGMFRLAGLWEHRKDVFVQNPTTSKILDRASTDLTRILNDSWNQGKELNWKLKHTGTNGDHITIEIEDPAIEGRYTRPSLRSSGFRTYFLLSMIIYARTHNKPSNSNIYLFDEPGTYLHPSAQLDLQRSFEAIADGAQIVYTTHSLFLVSKNYPERNRVISKTKDGTKIDQKPFSKNWKSVRESLGILLSNNFLIAEKTLLVEGPSDVIYLLDAVRSFKSRSALDVDLNDLSVVDAGDTQNYIAMAKIMLSEGRSIVALLDGDDSGNRVAKQLAKLCASDVESKRLHILQLPENESSEDVFANRETLKAAARKAFNELINSSARVAADGLDVTARIEDKIDQIDAESDVTLGRALDLVTNDWFSPPEKISKLLIATMYEDMQENEPKPVPDKALVQLSAIVKALSLRGEKSRQSGVFEEIEH